MKFKKFKYSSFLGFIILFSILFKSWHSYEHIKAELFSEKCIHKQYSDKHFTHKHNSHSNCFVCDFSFSASFAPIKTSFSLLHSFNFCKTQNSYIENDLKDFLNLSCYLRGPPFFIVS